MIFLQDAIIHTLLHPADFADFVEFAYFFGEPRFWPICYPGQVPKTRLKRCFVVPYATPRYPLATLSLPLCYPLATPTHPAEFADFVDFVEFA